YAKGAGVDEKDIIEENRSRNTEENIRYSSGLMDQSDAGRFAVVTSSYHIMRALLITRRQKLRCIGYGSSTKLYFSINAILREYAGYIRDTRRLWLFNMLVLTAVYIIFVFNH
ncbi:MAG: YdcF family protein, partial [Lachnospiraceae bacterium]|nr:YdcF family protein [Lachnospiraceae bacterium]